MERCEAHSSAPEEKRLYWLTNWLNNIYVHRDETLKAWGAIQTSLDQLSNPGYQQILRCLAVDKARNADQLEHAEAWMALCDPVATILDVDYNYRASRAMLHGARGEWPEALALAGESNDDVPFPPAGRLIKGSLRVTAYEKLGRAQEAEAAMGELLVATGSLRHSLLSMSGPGDLFSPIRVVWGRVDRRSLAPGPLQRDYPTQTCADGAGQPTSPTTAIPGSTILMSAGGLGGRRRVGRRSCSILLAVNGIVRTGAQAAQVAVGAIRVVARGTGRSTGVKGLPNIGLAVHSVVRAGAQARQIAVVAGLVVARGAHGSTGGKCLPAIGFTVDSIVRTGARTGEVAKVRGLVEVLGAGQTAGGVCCACAAALRALSPLTGAGTLPLLTTVATG